MDRPDVVILPPILILIALVALVVLRIIAPLPIGPWSASLILGALLSVVAVVLVRGAFAEMDKAGTNINPYQPSTAIVSTGPFRFTRNPIYLGMMSFFLAVSCFLNTWWGLILLVPVFCVLHFGVVLREEPYLERKFGAEYLSYKSKVRRYL